MGVISLASPQIHTYTLVLHRFCKTYLLRFRKNLKLDKFGSPSRTRWLALLLTFRGVLQTLQGPSTVLQFPNRASHNQIVHSVFFFSQVTIRTPAMHLPWKSASDFPPVFPKKRKSSTKRSCCTMLASLPLPLAWAISKYILPRYLKWNRQDVYCQIRNRKAWIKLHYIWSVATSLISIGILYCSKRAHSSRAFV